MPEIQVCSVDELSSDEPLLVETDDLELAVFLKDGEIFVIDDRCSHGPGSLSEGELDGYTVICDFHNGGFDIRTGEPVRPPCFEPVRTYAVRQEDGKVLIDTEAEAIACGRKIGAV